MKTFANFAAQGDLLFSYIQGLPKEAVEVAPENGRHIVGHSETGHHHVIDAASGRLYRMPSNPLLLILVVVDPKPIEHLRSFDTHEALLPAKPGVIAVKRQREWAPEGWRQVAD